ncbi:MAG: ankyrin repeat domain-containing protein, partial [Gammaproteobacteria bacterium]|nr:ankyrin repeat domain-containing protein [Gammaproteobacteria bacterium]
YSSVKDLKSLALLAIQYQAKESLLFLLQNMPKKDCQSKELMLAAIMSNDEEIANIVLKDCEDVNSVLDVQGNTAAHIAVMHGAHRVLPLLVESGVRLDKPNQKKQTPYHLAIAQEDDDMLKRLFKLKLSKPEEWPQDLWQIEATPLNTKIMRVLNKYKKYLPEKPKGAKPSLARVEVLREKIINPLPIGPVLSEADRHIIKLFKSSLRDADYDYALSLLNEFPILLKVLKSQDGAGWLTLLFENISELTETVLSKEEKEESTLQNSPLMDSSLETLFIFLKEQGVNPAHYLGKHNVLIAIIKAKTDKEACYRFERLARHFPQALPILANDKSENNKLGIAELCLSLNKEELFEKLDGYCQKLENDHHSSFYALHEAVMANNYGAVQRLLRRYPVDALNARGQTPLMLAASIGSVPLVNLLLKHGAFIDKCDRVGRNSLHYALDSSSVETALLILPLLRNPNQADRFGMTPMMKAALKGVVSVMRFLAETNHDIHSVDKHGHNALHYAALADQVESIAFLVSHKFSVDAVEVPLKESKIAKCQKKTPLMLAAEYGKENALYELLRLEANPEQKDMRGFGVCEYGVMSKNREVQDLIKKLPFYHDPERNLYLLHAAVMANETVILSELILSNVNPNALNTKGQNALHIACIYEATEAASLLLKGGSLVLDALDKFGYAPIHYAAQKGYVRLIRLLGENGADLNQKTTKGETPLSLACLNSHEGAVIALLEQGADFRQPNQDGMTPMHLALLKGVFPIVRLLQEAGDTSLNTDDFSSMPEQERKIIKFNLTLFSADKTSVRKTHLMRFLKPHKPENPIPIGLEDKSLALNKRIS